MCVCCVIRIAVDKIKSLDDAFRQQLDVKEQNHSRALSKLQQRADEQVNAANKRVSYTQSHTAKICQALRRQALSICLLCTMYVHVCPYQARYRRKCFPKMLTSCQMVIL